MGRAGASGSKNDAIWNGRVAASVNTGSDRRGADVEGELAVDGSGWLLLRAWNDGPHPDVLDIYPYATTSPVYVHVAGKPRRSAEAATYFMQWLDRIRAATEQNTSYRSAAERSAVLDDIVKAREFYERCLREARGEAR